MIEKKKKYILDGGSGQTLLEMGLKPEGRLWSATALINKNLHKMIIDMHLDFINAGSDLIVTSNFSVRKRRFLEYKKLEFFEQATNDSAILANKAKDISGKNILIAGSLPTQEIVYFSKRVTDDKEIYNGFNETAKILEPNVDLFYLDVLSSINEIKIACEAIKDFEKPILIGVHLNNKGYLPSEETIDDLIPITSNYNTCGIIAACVSPEIVNLVMPKLINQKLPFGFKVNAFKNIPENDPLDADLYDNGYPTERYGTRANQFSPEVFRKFVQNKFKDGATLLGGCCEIKPRHIKALTK
ncbi:MAG: homocysteine S-methyltransferase family protein [Alphaproteobacteria bacterium]